MSAKSKNRIRRRSGQALALLALAASTPRGWAQYTPPNATEPQWWDLNLSQSYLKVDAEGERESYSAKGSPATKNESTHLAPTVGLGFNGYAYHPDLFSYTLLAEPGFSWQQQGPPGGRMSQSYDYLLNGNGTATVLQQKPYATTFTMDRSHEIYDYDFFNSEIVDRQAWGVRSGYREGAVPFTVAFDQSHQDSSGLSLNSTLDQINLNVHARNERRREDATDLTYQFGQYDQVSMATAANYESLSDFNYATLTDVEHYRKSDLNSSVTFNEFNANGADSASLNSALDYSLELTPHLRNFYDYSLSLNTGNGDFQQHSLRAGLQHQLYESLNSTFDVHGAWADSSSPGASLQSLATGATLAEGYSKRLAEWGHLSVNGAISYDHTGQSSSGASLVVPNESHTLTTGTWVPLGQPNVLAILSVTTDPAHGSLPLVENVDYYVNRAVNPWLIEISPASVIIHSGDAVVATYTVEPNPSGNYSTINDQFQVRLELFENLLGLYVRYDNSDNTASSSEFVLENVTELQAGADLHWHGLRLDANYTDRKSSLNNYNSFSLSEGYTLLSSAHHTADINLRQQWSSYPNATTDTGTNQSQSETYYSFTLRYVWHPTGRLNWSTDAGYEQQRGYGLDENLMVARSNVSWHIGKLDLNLGYEYQNQEYTGETRDRNFFFLRMRRDF